MGVMMIMMRMIMKMMMMMIMMMMVIMIREVYMHLFIHCQAYMCYVSLSDVHQ